MKIHDWKDRTDTGENRLWRATKHGETGNLCRDFKNPRKDGQLMKKWKLKI